MTRSWRTAAAVAAASLITGLLVAGCADDSRGEGVDGRAAPSSQAARLAPPPDWVRHEVGSAFTIDTPAAWGRREPAPGPSATSILVGASMRQVPTGGGVCASPAALKSLPADGALFVVEENKRVGGQPYTFPPRPKRLALGPLLGPFKCWGVRMHTIAFEEGGRYLSAQVFFGQEASSRLRNEVRRSLNRLHVAPLPASERPAAKCRAGRWTFCPEAAWVYRVINRARIFHLGRRGTEAVLGLKRKRSFALWTMPLRRGSPPAGPCREVTGLRVCGEGERLSVRVQGVELQIEPARSPYATLKTQPALPDRGTLRRLLRAARSVPRVAVEQ